MKDGGARTSKIHARSKIINSEGENMLQKWTGKGLLKYVNDKKIQTWLKDRQIQFPLSLTKPDGLNVTDLDGNVKSFSVKTKTSFLLYANDIKKAEELTLMLQSRIKTNSAAYENNILYKSARVKELGEEYLMTLSEEINTAVAAGIALTITALRKPESLGSTRLNPSLTKADRGDIPTMLACVLNKEVIKNVDGKEESCPVIAFIEPNMGSEKATVILSAYPKEQYERFLEDNIKKGGLLYLKNKEALRRDSPVNHVTSLATVSFTGLLYTNNLARFNKNVNLKRVQNNGMALQFISEKKKSINHVQK